MTFYERRILPKLIHCVCGLKPMMRQREKVIPDARGVVLELGIGSGLNIPYYNPDRVDHLIGIDPTPNKKALNKALTASVISHDMIFDTAELLPMEDNTIDTVVTTYTFCTIPDLVAAIVEARRVLRPNGQLLFVEHGMAPDASVKKTQDRVNPFWKKIAGGCHLNRDIPNLLRDNGFIIDNEESMYLPGWKPATWNVWGAAHIA